MHQTVELVLKSYMPKHLEIGMWFITKINPGTLKEYTEIWTLNAHPHETLEEFIVKNGAPVEPYLIYDEQVIAEPHEIGWWDEGEHVDELRDIELSDINFILTEWDGYVDIEIDEHDYYNEEDDDDDDSWLCSHCNGSGYGATPDVACPVCYGEGELYPQDDEEDDTDEDDNS